MEHHRRLPSPIRIAESTIRRASEQDVVVDQYGFFSTVDCLKGFLGPGKREYEKLKNRLFMENGAWLLKELICSCQSRTNPIRMFSAEELEKATDNYDDGNIIGKGISFVFKGILNNRAVAIKRFDISSKYSTRFSNAVYDMFINEVVSLSQINHKNIVKLLGCCLESRYPILVYELIPNGDLKGRIQEEDPSRHMTWKDCLKNAREIADALAYLHTALPKPIIHTGIRSSRIFIDEFYSAKIGIFGFSLLIHSDGTHVGTKLVGDNSFGEPRRLNRYSEKNDVHDFGVVLIHLLTGKQNMVDPFISSMENNNPGLFLEARFLKEGKMEQLMECAVLAVRCVQEDGEKRPTMKEVAQQLRKMSKR